MYIAQRKKGSVGHDCTSLIGNHGIVFKIKSENLQFKVYQLLSVRECNQFGKCPKVIDMLIYILDARLIKLIFKILSQPFISNLSLMSSSWSFLFLRRNFAFSDDLLSAFDDFPLASGASLFLADGRASRLIFVGVGVSTTACLSTYFYFW